MLATEAGLSEKLVSVRHHIASQHLKTAGEAAKLLSKAIGTKLTAKEVKTIYTLLFEREPEWHHSGFYNRPGKGSGKKTMGRTYFFKEEEIQEIITRWPEVTAKLEAIDADNARKAQTIVKGFFFRWEKGERKYKGGPKRKVKVLDVYEGLEINAPRNFTACDDVTFANAKKAIGKTYTGWDSPSVQEFAQPASQLSAMTTPIDPEIIKRTQELSKEQIAELYKVEYNNPED